ncbi:MAG: hypothetical protein LBN95_05355 [Prevotellaceae bacterium]|jgi:hypothetical protein|nr:hypothetical protein [Prevotellaceae bacterium]
MKKYILLILVMSFSLSILGQERHGGIPIAFNAEKNNLQKFLKTLPDKKTIFSAEKRIFAEIDNVKEQQKADSIAEADGFSRKQLYGLTVPVNLDFKASATVENIGDTGKIYLLELVSPTAYALQVYFDKFKLPKGSRMFIYDSNRTEFLGSFTHENNFVDNKLGTSFIYSNSLIIEYYEPNIVEFEAQIHIEKLVHSFTEVRKGPFAGGNGADTCQVNVNCSLGYGWDKEKRAVALILAQVSGGYSAFCSGALINNTAQDGTPYFFNRKSLF